MQDEVVLPTGHFEDQVLLQFFLARASEFQRVQAKPPCEPLSFLENQRGQLQRVATNLVQSFPTVPQHSESHLSPLHPKAFSVLYFFLIIWLHSYPEGNLLSFVTDFSGCCCSEFSF
jgi:hypothetical protein